MQLKNKQKTTGLYYSSLSLITVCRVIYSYLSVYPSTYLFWFTFADLPKIDTGSTNEITASETESVTIPCTISAVPAVTSLQWLVNGNVIDTRNTLLYSGGSVAAPSLTILNLQTTQAGVYMCRATNDIGTSDSGNITVYVNRKFYDVITSRDDIIKQYVCRSTIYYNSRLLCSCCAFKFN